MIKHIPFDSLYLSDLGWLQSRFHFSFAEYSNPENIKFGVLRVMNDDWIAPHTGFDTHPHRDMEIVSYIIEGELTHQDSMGNKETIGRGSMQYMSAGTGVAHSEMNESDKKVRLIQTWILPERGGLKPNYGSKTFLKGDRHNRWLHLVGPWDSQDSAVGIHQDANIYVAELDNDQALEFHLNKERQAYLKVMEGSVALGGLVLNQGDAAEILEEMISLKATSDAHVYLVEMQAE